MEWINVKTCLPNQQCAVVVLNINSDDGYRWYLATYDYKKKLFYPEDVQFYRRFPMVVTHWVALPLEKPKD